MRTLIPVLAMVLSLCLVQPAGAAAVRPEGRLAGFDPYMEKLLADWNVPGVAVGVVVKDRLVLARGYGYRDYEKKLPVTPNTLFQIASNTKLFTATAIGLLVQERKLEWDAPIRRFVPGIRFYDDQLNNTVTIRDMLSHRTGISRHDLIWYKSDFTRQELFDRVQYLEPSQPLRQGFLYNNMMYAAAGQIVEKLSGRTWEDFVRERIFAPLGMASSMFSVADMQAQPDHAVPYNERRDSTTIYRIPFYEEAQGVGPAGSIISNVHDMSRWLMALMNGGRVEGKQVIPAEVLRATLEPSIALPNVNLENRGWGELLNPAYGMGRWTASYRGHLLAYHGGDLPGFHSQVSCMPYDSIGVVVFVIGDHAAPLYNVIMYNVYERLLGLDQTPWASRRLKDRLEAKAAGKEARKKSAAARVPGTHPSHPLADYAGEYEHPAYGVVTVTATDSALAFRFHHIALPLSHYHYDRFDSPDDEEDGLWSFRFTTSPQGEIDGFASSLDENEVRFVRKPDTTLGTPQVLARYVGTYRLAGTFVKVQLVERSLFLIVPGTPQVELVPLRSRVFTTRQFGDLSFEFVLENDRVTALKQVDPSGEYRLEKVD
ncbi:MAG TPA: serine hydrolase [Terriglobales bacterium]|nr:serine hydrolase [Terriglobales bacterium]